MPSMVSMHETVRKWIAEVLRNNPGPMAIALRQRAKFEGWLKFALAAHAELSGASKISVEAPASDAESARNRCDLSFDWDGVGYDVELKTPNTNWRMPGVAALTRPVTKNFSSIVEDARKVTSTHRQHLVAFVIFPVPCGDHRWQHYLERLGRELKLLLSVEAHAVQVTLPISQQHSADVVVCCFPVSTKVAEQLVQATA